MSDSGLSYRPALDGLRGVAVLAIVAFHAGGPVPGGWLGVDLFFVLSGYLICRILVRQHAHGGIDLRRFWTARARRLLPALVLTLGGVVAAGAVLAPPAMRPSLARDILATLGYVSNWSFMLGDEAYFGSLGSPSPLRHTWSLAVEEQFYLLFPLLLLLLLGWLRRTPREVAVLLAVGAVGSAVLMGWWYGAGSGLDRVYYGTDTHAQGLLVGAGVGMLMAPDSGVLGTRTRRRVEGLAGWLSAPALLVVVAAFFLGSERSHAFYRGGLLLFSLLAATVVVAAAGATPTPVQRLLSWRWLRVTGVISYGLYLWHWPVMVHLTSQRVGLGRWPTLVAQLALTFLLAGCSYVLVERRVRRHGFAALLPRHPQVSRVLFATTVPAIVVTAVLLPALPRLPTGAESSITLPAAQEVARGRSVATARGPTSTRPDAPRLEPHSQQQLEPVTAALLGNSVPQGLAEYFPAPQHRDLTVVRATHLGCDLIGTEKIVNGAVMPISRECRRFEAEWVDPVRITSADVVVYFLPHALLNDVWIDGRPASFGTEHYRQHLHEHLSSLRDQAQRAGATRFALVNLSCHRLPLIGRNSEVERMNSDSLVRELNGWVEDWAAGHGVQVIDQFSVLCRGGFHDAIEGARLYDDYMHFTKRSARLFWSWLAPRVIAVGRSA